MSPGSRLPNRLARWPIVVLGLLCLWGIWSYVTEGAVRVLVAGALSGDDSVERLRALIESAGAFGPLIYVAAVTVEVVVAPIPGTLLYAPGGALFGGLLGGTLSLIGNVLGASLATWLGARFGARALQNGDWPRLQQYAERIRRRGLLLVALLRVNPLTSSDLVSYAAGVAGVPIWRVAAGTAIGMAPLCYAQSYAAEWLFDVLPGSALIVIGMGVAYFAVVVIVLVRGSLARR